MEASVKKEVFKPTPDEVRAHNKTHLPFRSWCPHCVNGKAQGHPHFRGDTRDDHDVPTISIDYSFLTSQESVSDESDESVNHSMPILCYTDDHRGTVYADVVPNKRG